MNFYYIYVFIILCILIYLVDRYDIYDYNPDVVPKFGMANIKDEYIFPETVRNFITKEEADYILTNSMDKFSPSVVYGNNVVEKIRKSNTVWLSKHDPIIKNIVQRVCDKCNIPFKNAEHLQVVKYDPDGYYKGHHDTISDDEPESRSFLSHGGHRIITMLIYLNDEFEGGETAFINLKKKVKPPKYSGVLFYSLDKKGEHCHPFSLHAGRTVLSGNKYVANIWLRQNKFIA
jgi:prolyl 4-hydroxylase